MKFEEFKTALVKILKGCYEDRAEVVVHQVYKNGCSYEGICIRLKGAECCAVPVFDVEEYYEAYKTGKMTLDKCVHTILEMNSPYEQMSEIERKVDIKSLLVWEEVKNEVYPVLFPVKGNEQMLEPLVKRNLLDLAVVYIIRNAERGMGTAVAKISESLLNLYGITEEELHRQAMKNLEKDGYMFIDFEQIILQLCSEQSVEEISYEPTQELSKGRMYILRNKSGFYGAAGILNEKLLKKAIGYNDAYIIPSSVNEVIVILEEEGMCVEELNEIIKEVNQQEVEIYERLSDHYYYYEGKSGKLKMCA